MATFGDVWRKVKLHVPSAPPLLCRNWVQDAYRDLCDRRGWTFLVMEGQLVFADARTLTATVTLGSATVTSAALFVNGDAGRQFRVGSFPVYTILTVVDPSTITLDRAYETFDATGAQSATILDAYATLPVAFGRFVTVLDPINQRLIPWWATQEELDLIDPTRQASDGPPRLLVARKLSEYTLTAGQLQYEYWPVPTSAGALQYYAIKRPIDLADEDAFVGLLATRADILELGALARAALWPGTAEVKNPYFDLRLAAALQMKFDALANQLDLRDDDQSQQSWSTIPWHRWSAWGWAYDTHLLQQTDATVADYAGGYGSIY